MILEDIVRATNISLEARRKKHPLEEIKDKIFNQGKVNSFNDREPFEFESSLMKNGSKEGASIAFICEVKKASPSKGIISEDFPYLSIAKEYEKAGAAAISVLTEADFFMGSPQYLMEISKNVRIPVLRKDFIIDEYQIYESKLIGADALLLICSILNPIILKEYLALCNRLGLSALVEAHSEEEIRRALEAGARVIGVNNRNLNTFEVDIANSLRLRNLVPRDVIFVAESGINSSKDINLLEKAGVHGALIGEALMRSKDKVEFIKELRGYDSY
jgi:indole-3-glycerol phosphate synthase